MRALSWPRVLKQKATHLHRAAPRLASSPAHPRRILDASSTHIAGAHPAGMAEHSRRSEPRADLRIPSPNATHPGGMPEAQPGAKAMVKWLPLAAYPAGSDSRR